MGAAGAGRTVDVAIATLETDASEKVSIQICWCLALGADKTSLCVSGVCIYLSSCCEVMLESSGDLAM